MSKLSEKKRLLLTIAVSVVFTGGLLALILSDRGEIEALEAEVEEFDQRITAADLEIERTPEREERVVVFRAVEERELAVLPSEQKIAEFYQGLSKFFVAAGLRFRELPESQPVESDLAKGIYVTRSVVEGQGEASSILKFLNMLENDPRLVSIKGLKIEAADQRKAGDETDAPLLHDVTVHLESYYYNPAGVNMTQLTIQGEEQRLESATVKQAIADFVPERPAKHDLKISASRRDPLVDPRERRVQVNEEAAAADLARQELVVTELEATLADAREMDEQVRALLASGELFKADRLQAEMDVRLNELRVRLAQVQQMKTVTNATFLGRVLAVQQRADELMGRRLPRETSITRALAEKTLGEIQGKFARGLYAEVATLCQAWVEFMKGKQVEPDAQASNDEIAALRTRARILAETEGFALVIGGTIVHESEPSRSQATINGVMTKVGDAADTAGEVRILAVRRDGVDFIYKGETFTRLRNSGGAAGGPAKTPPKGPKAPKAGASPKAAPQPTIER